MLLFEALMAQGARQNAPRFEYLFASTCRCCCEGAAKEGRDNTKRKKMEIQKEIRRSRINFI